MNVVRYSAVEMFGAPVDEPESLGVPGNALSLMESYNIEPQEIEVDIIDITPSYWNTPKFKYFLSKKLSGIVEVDLLPIDLDSEAYLIASLTKDIKIVLEGIRHLVIPTDQETMAIAGGSPRFTDKICLHELIATVK